MKKFLISILILQFSMPFIKAQEWVVPEDKKGKLSTFQFDDNSRKAGEKLFNVNCMSCHGTPGKGNFLKLVPPPGDPATDKIQHNTDGEIFFKVTEGRGQMPSFKSVLTPTETWNIISYLRSFNSKYSQQVMKVITSSAYPGSVIGILLNFNKAENSIGLKAVAVKENSRVPVEGAGVKLLVERRFGHLPVDEEKTTDKDGMATFKLPAGLPGDSAGNIRVSAMFTNEERFGAVVKDTVLQAGTVTIPVSLTAQRAMWNNVRKAPVWIILTYSLGVLIAWGFIFIVLMKLRDIFIVGETLTKDTSQEEN
jgi:mono/diheme cytochrome c family protein